MFVCECLLQERDEIAIALLRYWNPPSANPKLSTTGRSARTVKNSVPSFISSETMRPRRLATTPYTLPKTSAMSRRSVQSLSQMNEIALEAWISQVYMASISLGDQSRRPLRQASRTDVMNAPVTCAIRLCSVATISRDTAGTCRTAYASLVQYPLCPLQRIPRSKPCLRPARHIAALGRSPAGTPTPDDDRDPVRACLSPLLSFSLAFA